MPGPAPGSRCAACRHRSVSAINAALNSGVSQREVALTFGLGKDTVNRHVTGLHPGVDPRDNTPRPEWDDSNSGQGKRFDEMEVLRQILEHDVRTGKVRSTEAARELRPILAELHKMERENEPTEVSISDVAGLADFFSELVGALEPHPEARRLLSELLVKKGLAG